MKKVCTSSRQGRKITAIVYTNINKKMKKHANRCYYDEDKNT